jgi:hypothetical protein
MDPVRGLVSWLLSHWPANRLKQGRAMRCAGIGHHGVSGGYVAEMLLPDDSHRKAQCTVRFGAERRGGH